MRRGYSINGYLNKILRSSAKTLLVEGATDKLAITRIAAQHGALREELSVIDSSELISDDTTCGMGNKQKIIALQNAVVQIGADRFSEKLRTLQDREWDGLGFQQMQLADDWTPPDQHEHCFTTIGHSIENYYISTDYIKCFIRDYYPQHARIEFFEQIDLRFDEAASFAVSFSLAVRDSEQITRCSGLLNPNHIQSNGLFFELLPSFDEALLARAAPAGCNIYLKTNHSNTSYWRRYQAAHCIKWLIHGHIGLDAIWSCVGLIAAELGFSGDAVFEITRGHQRERERFGFNWLASKPEVEYFPLNIAIAWLSGRNIKNEAPAA